MNIFIWIVQGVVAALFLMVGVMKLIRTKEQLFEMLAWTDDFSLIQIRLIGLVEILGGLGLVLPMATGILPWLTPLAAVGLALDMLVAASVHLRRKENGMIIGNLVILALAGFIAYGRFVLLPVS